MIVLAGKPKDNVYPPYAERWRCKGCGTPVCLTDVHLGDMARKHNAKVLCGACVLEQDGVRNIREKP